VHSAPIFDVVSFTSVGANGESTYREWIVHSGAAAVLPVLPDGKILLVEQYRPAIAASLIEIPAGRLERDETPLACAERELLEETGHVAASWCPLVTFCPTPGYSDERIHIFVASEMRRVTDPEHDEISRTRSWSVDRILGAYESGGIVDGKTILAVCLYVLRSRPP
jgi:ADP-ribose pyrophosphatase